MRYKTKDQLIAVGKEPIECSECSDLVGMSGLMWRIDGDDGSGMRCPKFLLLCEDCYSARQKRLEKWRKPTIKEGTFFQIETSYGAEFVRLEDINVITSEPRLLTDELRLYLEGVPIDREVSILRGFGVLVSDPDTAFNERWTYVGATPKDARVWILDNYYLVADPEHTAWDGEVHYLLEQRSQQNGKR